MSGYIFVDVNGTLIPSGLRRPTFSASWLARFRTLVAELASVGFKVGLCSDSPLPQLQRFGEQIGLPIQGAFPILAENGNVFAYEDEVSLLTSSTQLTPLRSQIEMLAKHAGLRKLADVVAPEFGTGAIRMNANQWAYGANRLTSLAVFAPRAFIASAGNEVIDWARSQRLDIGFDCSPDNNFLAAHPYDPVSKGKGIALARLAATERVLMIGNSHADWVDPSTKVRCAFVGDADIATSIRSRAWYMSSALLNHGVLDVLTHVQQTQKHWELRKVTE